MRGSRIARACACTAVAVFVASVAGSASAGTASTVLLNGAQLSATIASPLTGATFLVPPAATGVDVPISGNASIGEGAPNVHWTYVVDVSGSTGSGCGGAGGTVLDCEKQAVTNLNNDVDADGSALDVGLSVFSETGATADMTAAAGEQSLASPASADVDTVIGSVVIGGVGQFTAKSVGSGSTNFTAGLTAALTSVQASSAVSKNVVFLSDGASNTGGGGFNAAVAALDGAGATIFSFAVGAGSSCTAGSNGTLQAMADATGGTCTNVPDPANLPAIVKNVTDTELQSVSLSVDAAATAFDSIAPTPPVDGPVSTPFTATAANQPPGAHQVCVSATGTGPKSEPSSQQTVTQCETYYVFGFQLTPSTATNELGVDHVHTVTATVTGEPGHLAGWPVTFTVAAGPNVGTSGTCSPAACLTDVNGNVTFTYNVPVAPSSLGTDTIKAIATINTASATLNVNKVWRDTTPPKATCVAGPNPDGTIPKAPGNGGQGQNQDGFYTVSATDDVWGTTSLKVFVKDGGSGFVFGPFDNPTNIKWTQAPGGQPSQKPGAGVVKYYLKGSGDATTFAVDGSGNTATAVSCLVPPAPK